MCVGVLGLLDSGKPLWNTHGTLVLLWQPQHIKLWNRKKSFELLRDLQYDARSPSPTDGANQIYSIHASTQATDTRRIVNKLYVCTTMQTMALILFFIVFPCL